MVNLLKSRTNYYETLGVVATASEREIREAFKRKINLFQSYPLGAAAEVCMAFETLRDPVKRKEHDRLLGLRPEEPRPMTIAVAQPRWTPFIASPRFNPGLNPVERSAAPATGPAPPAPAEREADAPLHPRIAAITASLEELARPIGSEARHSSTGEELVTSVHEPRRAEAASVHAKAASLPLPAAPNRPPTARRKDIEQRTLEQRLDTDLEEVVRQIRDSARVEKPSLRKRDDRPFSWPRIAVAAGGLLLGAAVFGALAGLSVKQDEGGRGAASLFVPSPAKHRSSYATASLPAVAVSSKTAVPLEEPAHLASSRTRRTVALSKPRGVPDQPFAVSLPPAATETIQDAPDQPSPVPVAAAPAKLPLPANVIARTIDRIGYSCGSVAATAALADKAPGVFRVTCTSGQSFDASPLRGRYHFRRVADR